MTPLSRRVGYGDARTVLDDTDFRTVILAGLAKELFEAIRANQSGGSTTHLDRAWSPAWCARIHREL